MKTLNTLLSPASLLIAAQLCGLPEDIETTAAGLVTLPAPAADVQGAIAALRALVNAERAKRAAAAAA